MTVDVSSIRYKLAKKLLAEDFRPNGTIELIGSSFQLTDTPERAKIFGEPNEKYIAAEITWYDSCSRFVDDLATIYGKRVKIWDDIASPTGEVNSNYGYCIYSNERGCQYYNAVQNLVKDQGTRQATMIYQDPHMHRNAGKDFTCTNAVQYYLRPHEHWDDHWRLDSVVQMRSNDVVFGFINDYAWQQTVVRRICSDLYWGFRGTGHYQYPQMNVVPGNMIWQASSLHVYPRHFDLVREWWEGSIYAGA